MSLLWVCEVSTHSFSALPDHIGSAGALLPQCSWSLTSAPVPGVLQTRGINLSCIRTCVVVAEERPRIALQQSFSKLFKDIGLSPRAVSTTFGSRVNVAICLQVTIMKWCLWGGAGSTNFHGLVVGLWAFYLDFTGPYEKSESQRRWHGTSFGVQWVKDPALPQLWLRSKLQLRVSPRPGCQSHMPQVPKPNRDGGAHGWILPGPLSPWLGDFGAAS